jgi:hypothetical protein
MFDLIWTAAILFTAAVGLLFFAVIVVSIHRSDRAKGLARRPRGRMDTMTRRVLGVPTSSLRRAGRHS